MYKLPIYKTIKSRIEEPRRFIQVIMGPRQVGKSTVVKQVLKAIDIPYLAFSADNVPASNSSWIDNCWAAARGLMDANSYKEFVLVIDEIQKIKNWSEIVKKEWDADSFAETNIKVILLGSSRVMLEKGLSESLAGRFEEIRMAQWDFAQMKDCFGISLDQYIFFGGYPGAASLIDDEDRFQQYIRSAIVDATINKDILVDSPVAKPALLEQTFELGAAYSGNLLSLTKMVGSLQDAGNTSTLANYLRLLNESGLLKGLEKYSVDMALRKASIPKLQVYNNALKTIFSPFSFRAALIQRDAWGHIFESAIGAHIISQSFVKHFDVFYWRDRNMAVDFILRKKQKLVAIEVKSNAQKASSGLETFKEKFSPTGAFIVGQGGIPPQEFLSLDLSSLF